MHNQKRNKSTSRSIGKYLPIAIEETANTLYKINRAFNRDETKYMPEKQRSKSSLKNCSMKHKEEINKSMWNEILGKQSARLTVLKFLEDAFFKSK
jgi:hypothetical protein